MPKLSQVGRIVPPFTIRRINAKAAELVAVVDGSASRLSKRDRQKMIARAEKCGVRISWRKPGGATGMVVAYLTEGIKPGQRLQKETRDPFEVRVSRVAAIAWTDCNIPVGLPSLAVAEA